MSVGYGESHETRLKRLSRERQSRNVLPATGKTFRRPYNGPTRRRGRGALSCSAMILTLRQALGTIGRSTTYRRGGTFLTAVAAVIAVASIIADEVARPRGAVAVLLAWAIGASMQIIAGITARLRAETAE